MAGNARVGVALCPSSALLDGGAGVRFDTVRQGRSQPAFAIRFRGQVHAYVNACRHQQSELDWRPGEFFDQAKLYLVCATHGALYAPDSGVCIAGPCRGARLLALPVQECDGHITCHQDERPESRMR